MFKQLSSMVQLRVSRSSSQFFQWLDRSQLSVFQPLSLKCVQVQPFRSFCLQNNNVLLPLHTFKAGICALTYAAMHVLPFKRFNMFGQCHYTTYCTLTFLRCVCVTKSSKALLLPGQTQTFEGFFLVSAEVFATPTFVSCRVECWRMCVVLYPSGGL